MYKSQIKSRYRHHRKTRICQGDLFRDLLVSVGSGSGTEHLLANLDYAVVLTQDCDLEQDHRERIKKPVPIKKDKYIDTILICPAYGFDDFVDGTHIAGRQMETFESGKLRDRIKANDVYKRYHYLSEDLDNGVVELVIDFKHFITAPRSLLYKKRKENYVTTINEIYREELSHRFANFLSRIGLPDNSSS